MDDIVKAALVKWPNVPHCHGWLALDARGDWYMRDDRCQAAGPFPHPQEQHAHRHGRRPHRGPPVHIPQPALLGASNLADVLDEAEREPVDQRRDLDQRVRDAQLPQSRQQVDHRRRAGQREQRQRRGQGAHREIAGRGQALRGDRERRAKRPADAHRDGRHPDRDGDDRQPHDARQPRPANTDRPHEQDDADERHRRPARERRQRQRAPEQPEREDPLVTQGSLAPRARPGRVVEREPVRHQALASALRDGIPSTDASASDAGAASVPESGVSPPP